MEYFTDQMVLSGVLQKMLTEFKYAKHRHRQHLAHFAAKSDALSDTAANGSAERKGCKL